DSGMTVWEVTKVQKYRLAYYLKAIQKLLEVISVFLKQTLCRVCEELNSSSRTRVVIAEVNEVDSLNSAFHLKAEYLSAIHLPFLLEGDLHIGSGFLCIV